MTRHPVAVAAAPGVGRTGEDRGRREDFQPDNDARFRIPAVSWPEMPDYSVFRRKLAPDLIISASTRVFSPRYGWTSGLPPKSALADLGGIQSRSRVNPRSVKTRQHNNLSGVLRCIRCGLGFRRRGRSRQRRCGFRRWGGRGLRGRCSGKPLDGRADCVPRTAVLYCVQDRACRTGALNAALRIRQDDRIVPGPPHHEGQLEGRYGNIRAPRGDRQQARGPLQVELARRNRCRARQIERNARTLHANVFDIRLALGDFQIDGQSLVGRFAAAELAAARERAPLDAPSNCSTLKPAIAPLRLVRPAVPFNDLVKS